MMIPVRVPLHLRRTPTAGEPAAVFLPGCDAAALLSACARLGVDPSGRVRAVAGGFVVELNRPAAGPFVLPGAVRLRELAPGLLVPVDAQLVPALLDDESAGLVRDGGLVFLPNGRVLGYDRRSAVALSALVAASPAPPRGWQPLPEPRLLAGRIVEIARDEPDESPEALYDQMSEDWRDPGASGRPARDRRKSGRGEKGAGAVEGGAGVGLGGAMGSLFNRAGAGARSLGESMRWSGLNQSQLLQKLLREFRQGDPSRALRHALPVSPEQSGGRSFVPLGNRLPISRAIYNLMELLGGPRRGQNVGVWSAPPNLVAELTREYHRAAEAALRQGDYRRAAYIYGKLLGDDRSAALALRRGGLDHDAAILFLVKVRDEAAAAQAFEAAGEYERAIALYMKLRRHEQAGDLLRRLGYEDVARREYQNAIAVLQDGDGPTDWLEVGRICDEKLGDPELAIGAYVFGWAQRPGPNATACVLRLLRISAARGEAESIARLLDQCDAFFRDRGANDARDFYNDVAAIAAADAGTGLTLDEVRDRALRVMGHHIRRLVAASAGARVAIVSSLFAEPALWTPAIARDAQFAATRASADRHESVPVHDPVSSVPGSDVPLRAHVMRVGRGTVTAAASAPASFQGFLGFDDGQIHAILRDQDRTELVGDVGGPVAALATEPTGKIVVALCHTDRESVLTSFIRWPDGTFRLNNARRLTDTIPQWLTSVLAPENLIGVSDGGNLVVHDACSWFVQSRLPCDPPYEPVTAAVLVPHREAFGLVVSYGGSQWALWDRMGNHLSTSPPAGQPVTSGRQRRCAVPLTTLTRDSEVRIVGLDDRGAVHDLLFAIKDDALELKSAHRASVEGGFLAVVPAWDGRVIAATPERLVILGRREGSAVFQELRSGVHNSGPIAACFLAKDPGEVVLVEVDGWVSRVSLPLEPATPRKGQGAR